MSPSGQLDPPAREPAGSGSAPQAHREAESPWTRIKEHKVLQWSLAYLGAALALAHGQELLAHNFGWPELVGHVLIGLLIVGFPIAIALAWYHGHRGMTRISAGELTVVSLLLVIAAVLLTALVRPGESATEPGVRPPPVQASASGASPATFPTPAVSTSSKPRLAILPFENLSPDPANAFFTDGLHEEIITALATSAPALEVISRTTMMTYRDVHKTVTAIAKELGATHVLEGSVRRDGDEVRLTLQLIDARTDDHLWAQNYDRKLVKAMTLESEVAEEVASQLSVKLVGNRGAEPTTDPQAYDLYLKARLKREAVTPITPIATLRSIEALLNQAIARDRSFALAYATRSDLRASMYVFNLDTSEQLLTAARTDLDMAERLRPNDPAWLVLEAGWAEFDQRYPRALELLSAAEEAGLMNSDTLMARARTLGYMGRYDETLPLLESAASLDPGNAGVLGYWALVLAYLHRPADAIRVYTLAIDRAPDFAPLGRIARDSVRYAFTGDNAAADRSRLAVGMPRLSDAANYAKAREWAAALPARQPASTFNLLAADGIGQTPRRAVELGRLEFQFGHREAAAQSGREILEFVAGERAGRHNAWYLKSLTATGKMYLGDEPGALAAAYDSMNLAPRSANAFTWAIARELAAPVLAWAGEQDQAVALLEQLLAAVPGATPAEIARDPILALVLGGNAPFRALVARLEAQMAATKLE